MSAGDWMAPEERGKRRGDRSGILDQHPVVHTCNDDTLDIGQRRQKPPMSLAKARPERVAFPAEHSQDRLRDSLRLILVERPRSQTEDLLLEPCRRPRRLGRRNLAAPDQVGGGSPLQTAFSGS